MAQTRDWKGMQEMPARLLHERTGQDLETWNQRITSEGFTDEQSLRDGDTVYHTYSTTGRGTDITGSTYSLLDLTPLGRQEDWEQPPGRSDTTAC